MSWTLDNNMKMVQCSSTIYTDNTITTTTCCYTTYKNNLRCNAAGGNGWEGGYLTINGEQYCHESEWSSSVKVYELNLEGK